MKIKTKNFFKKYWWVGLIILLGIILTMVFGLDKQSYMQLTEETKEFNFDGVDGIVYSTYFGTATTSPNLAFCRSNDLNDATITNLFIDGNFLTLKSELQLNKADCRASNYIRGEGDFPPGTLIASCETFGFDAKCKINNEEFKSGTKEFNFDELTNVEAWAISSGEPGVESSVSSKSRLTLNFEPDDISNGDTEENTTNGDGTGDGNGDGKELKISPLLWLIIGIILLLIIFIMILIARRFR